LDKLFRLDGVQNLPHLPRRTSALRLVRCHKLPQLRHATVAAVVV
jgi:hypothetical protein